MLVVKKIINILLRNHLFLVVFSFSAPLWGKEGMWIPATLKDREKDLKESGLEIPVDQLYKADGSGLNNAIVLFGRGCTGELISSNGMILTNHHCGYGSVQRLSSTDHDYFANGFWAMNHQEELPCPGLTVTFFRRMENVTAQVLSGIPLRADNHTKDSLSAINIAKTEEEFTRITGLDATIRSMFEGTQFWIFITQTYKDIRLAGFPPNSIGAFGGDEENWMWPRHTGDFSLFRIYAGKNNEPAEYAKDNVPYQTSQFLTISTKGYKEGDFTMVYGFPGSTSEYISSWELQQTANIADPICVKVRTQKLQTWKKHMNANREVFLKYTSKYSGVANGWKKWQGEMEGLKADHALAKKETFEMHFQAWAEKQDQVAGADQLLDSLENVCTNANLPMYADIYAREAVLGIELVQQASALEKLQTYFRMNLTDVALRDSLTKAEIPFAGFFKNYDSSTDREIFTRLMPLYFNNCQSAIPAYFKEQWKKYHGNYQAWAEYVFKNSILTSENKLKQFIQNAATADSTKLKDDPAWKLFEAINVYRKTNTIPLLTSYYTQKKALNKAYLIAQMQMDKDKTFYPDANLTLRLAYGKVKGLKDGKPLAYRYQTTLGDVVALNNPKSLDFKVPAKLTDLYNKKDFGRWSEKGKMPVAFIATNHTTGGNSGSPVLNSKGQLMGLNFDRAYEGTMSDYAFSDDRCRNIAVDIRYVLFIMEKFGGAGWLIDEMNLE